MSICRAVTPSAVPATLKSMSPKWSSSPKDVGEHLIAAVLFDQAHRDTGDRGFGRHTGVHQRQARAADRGHRARAVRLGDLGYHANHVRKRRHVRHHRFDAATGEPAMADFAPLRRADEACLADAVRREVVMQHERVAPLAFERIDDLRVAAGAERGYDERLRLAAREHGRAVRSRQHAHLNVDRAHGVRVATVDARLARDECGRARFSSRRS